MAAEVIAAVRFALSFGPNDLLERRFARVLGNSPIRSVSHADLVLSCDVWAAVARKHAADLAGLLPRRHPARLAAKADELLRALGDRHSELQAMTSHTSNRNRVIERLDRLVREIRRAAACYPRDDPELLREFATSRRRRRTQRAGDGHLPRSASSVSTV